MSLRSLRLRLRNGGRRGAWWFNCWLGSRLVTWCRIAAARRRLLSLLWRRLSFTRRLLFLLSCFLRSFHGNISHLGVLNLSILDFLL